MVTVKSIFRNASPEMEKLVQFSVDFFFFAT